MDIKNKGKTDLIYYKKAELTRVKQELKDVVDIAFNLIKNGAGIGVTHIRLAEQRPL